MHGRRSYAIRLIALVAIALSVSAGSWANGAEAQATAEATLASKYSPILMLKQQKTVCDYRGEG